MDMLKQSKDRFVKQRLTDPRNALLGRHAIFNQR
jgi:hypothetical protein